MHKWSAATNLFDSVAVVIGDLYNPSERVNAPTSLYQREAINSSETGDNI